MLTDEQIDEIVSKLVDSMKKRIGEMEIEYPNVDTDNWEVFTENGCCDMEIGDLHLEYEYDLSCDYCLWTEYWIDPACCPSFIETDNENGELERLSISMGDEEGNETDSETINVIINRVNNILNPLKRRP